MLVVLVALESPIDRLAERYFWVHMLQHELLLMVAPPLVLLGSRFRRCGVRFRRRGRRQVARVLVTSVRWQALWRAVAGWRTPRAARFMFMANFFAWHVP